jgi:DNA-binding NtrC family response regulator
MEQAAPIVMVVEDDVLQRELAAVLFEESEMEVVQCASAEAALRVLVSGGDHVAMLFTDVNLAGNIDGVELAHFARQWYPNIHVVVTSGRGLTKSLPEGTTFLPKPWLPLDMLREVERSLH